MPDLRLDDNELGWICQQDYSAGLATQEDVTTRKMAHYAMYRAYRNDTSDGNSGRTDPNAKGPFKWSRLVVPFAYYIVETLLSRLSTDTPEITVTPRTVSAVAYAEAKQLRINHMLNDVGWDNIVVAAVKDMLIMGDGIVKVYWDPEEGCPKISHVRWLDFCPSTEADTLESAACLFHRTWHTRESLEHLADKRGSNGRKLYRNIEQIATTSQDRTAADNWWTTARQV